MKMNKIIYQGLALASIAQALAGGPQIFMDMDPKLHRGLKNCIHCGRPHNGKNPWCSGICCKTYRKMHKGGK